jgi:hypothetical protein
MPGWCQRCCLRLLRVFPPFSNAVGVVAAADVTDSDARVWGDGAWEADDMCWLCGKWRPVRGARLRSVWKARALERPVSVLTLPPSTPSSSVAQLASGAPIAQVPHNPIAA